MSAETPTGEFSPVATDQDRAVDAAELDPWLLSLLVCPVTREALEYDRARGELVSPKAGLAYPIRDGIPIMLPEEARALDA